jgi:hypothetical protein
MNALISQFLTPKTGEGEPEKFDFQVLKSLSQLEI